MFLWEAVNAVVHDIRDNEDTISLDTQVSSLYSTLVGERVRLT